MNSNIITIDSNESIKKACDVYRDNNIGSVLVTENEQVVGIVTERDIIERTICMDKDPATTPIREIMSANVKTVDVNDRINYAVELLKKHHIKKLAVTEKDEVIGIVTVTDIAYSRPNIRKFIKPEA